MNYFFVSQRDQAKENEMKKLTAPDDKSHSYVAKYIHVDDLIVQYNSVSLNITGVAQAIKKPYVVNGTIYADIDIYNFESPLPKDVWVKKLREKQGEEKTPVNENYSVNSRYLQKMNEASFNYILEEAQKFEKNKDVVDTIRKLASMDFAEYPSKKNQTVRSNQDSTMVQKILFGAPGTGKSFKIDDPVNGYGLKNVGESRKFRTTFHPDYDYAQFVGAYKPKKELNKTTNKEELTYSFVPQVFAKAYAAAWKQYFAAGNESTAENQVYLVIEEINRGNCAQIFGDVFQLLDRDSEGFSQYSIDADCDFATWLKEDSILKTVWNDYEAKVGDGKLNLPPNLNILATMNTSDQSLFPMDSAFKRRFDWEYVPIKYAKDSDCGDDWKADEFKIVIGDTTYKWLDFLKKVNADIYDATQSEDKQMGEFFIKPKSGDLKIAFNEFRSKVLFYLWDSVYKDETERQAVFHFPYGDGDGKINSVTFQSLFGKDAEAIVNKIMENLKVEKVTA
ncbi:AAA family ATPase [Fibrobacter sp.]|uniref:AAA family ATPase n=1 Tax=Fibrobacter sp. TaxID=35828 RepID=UPI003890604D